MQFDIFFSYVAQKWRWTVCGKDGKLFATGSRLYSSSATCRAGARKFFNELRGPGYVVFNVIPKENANALRPAKRY